MDQLGLVATDELGREYAAFNLVFGEGGLLFAVALKRPDRPHP